jgi:hypothetical protein
LQDEGIVTLFGTIGNGQADGGRGINRLTIFITDGIRLVQTASGPEMSEQANYPSGRAQVLIGRYRGWGGSWELAEGPKGILEQNQRFVEGR